MGSAGGNTAKVVGPDGGFRSSAEQSIGPRIQEIFEKNPCQTLEKLENFPKYIRRQKVTRYLALYELFKCALPMKGSIVECGVHHGFGLMSWANFSAVLEPNNLTRRIYGFDTFSGFSRSSAQDVASQYTPKIGDLKADSFEELSSLIEVYDDNRFLGHVPKVSLIPGDICNTAPRFIEENPHIVISLLFMDLDLYEPTQAALRAFLPRMPKGAIIAFDELDNPIWPGETLALLDEIGISSLELRRFDFDPYIAYAQIGY
ncbi:MAG: class I SAM-dependent methyltransferase [Bdellovibrionales bacterium]|nr:class I SAM-dependent methyltransferase [Bdellovibrionales bacterium]